MGLIFRKTEYLKIPLILVEIMHIQFLLVWADSPHLKGQLRFYDS